MFVTTTESLKRKATIIRTFLKEKYNVDISQGHSLELVSKIFDFKDWNTASATLKEKLKQKFSPVEIESVGDLRKALESFDDEAMIDADYTFKVQEIEDYQYNDPEDEIYQEFSFTVEKTAFDMVTLKLQLEHESGPPGFDWRMVEAAEPESQA